MNRIKIQSLASCLAMLAMIAGTYSPAARAKDRKVHPSAAIKVVGSMTFDNKSATDMVIRQVRGKSYLYVQLANDNGVVVVDISKPNKLKIVSSMPSQGAGHLTINGNAAIMTAEVGDSATRANSGELVLWDISDPQNPQVVQRFTGVVRVLHDDRHYTYILNQDGLWVVWEKQDTDNDDSWKPSING